MIEEDEILEEVLSERVASLEEENQQLRQEKVRLEKQVRTLEKKIKKITVYEDIKRKLGSIISSEPFIALSVLSGIAILAVSAIWLNTNKSWPTDHFYTEIHGARAKIIQEYSLGRDRQVAFVRLEQVDDTIARYKEIHLRYSITAEQK